MAKPLLLGEPFVRVASAPWWPRLRNFPGLCRLWIARSGERLVLRALDERLLKDIGADRATAAREAALPFWRP